MIKQTDKEVQESYLQLQMIDSQLQQQEKELIAIEQKKQEIVQLIENIGELRAESNSFSEVGMGIFAQSKLADTKELLVNVGAGVFVRKAPTEIKELLKNQNTQFENLIQQLAQNMQMLSIQAQILQGKMQGSLIA